MHQLPVARKLYLLEQHNQYRVASAKPHSHVAQPSYPATYGPSSAGNLLPRLVPQLSGDSGIMKRLSITGWGAASAASGSNRKGERPVPSSPSTQTNGAKATEELQPLQPQTTGDSGRAGGFPLVARRMPLLRVRARKPRLRSGMQMELKARLSTPN